MGPAPGRPLPVVRQADALRAYQDLRGILGEELGLEPSATLVRLEGVIPHHEAELDWPPTTSVPAPTPSLKGVVTSSSPT